MNDSNKCLNEGLVTAAAARYIYMRYFIENVMKIQCENNELEKVCFGVNKSRGFKIRRKEIIKKKKT